MDKKLPNCSITSIGTDDVTVPGRENYVVLVGAQDVVILDGVPIAYILSIIVLNTSDEMQDVRMRSVYDATMACYFIYVVGIVHGLIVLILDGEMDVSCVSSDFDAVVANGYATSLLTIVHAATKVVYSINHIVASLVFLINVLVVVRS